MAEKGRPNAGELKNDARSAAVLAEAERRHVPRFHERAERDERPPQRLFRRRGSWLFNRILLLIILVLLALIVFYKVGGLLESRLNIEVPESLSAFMPDETMGYSQIDFSNAVLGESRAKSDFVVLEQDVTVTSRVSQALANLALFEKYQIIRSYGTGVYTVDLSKLTADDVTVDETLQQVTVTIPHAALAYVTVDVEKTEYEETEKALFAFGEIKLTNEQLNLLEQSIDEAMHAQLETADMLAKADAHAISQVQKLLEPVVQSVAADYIVSVELQPAS
ncbi:MAG TPA: DUF4230 domain-containing protein [Eubacteriales bacterium]|nr:DUF4230 domain-containing protein [Eubacteriales bacterium]